MSWETPIQCRMGVSVALSTQVSAMLQCEKKAGHGFSIFAGAKLRPKRRYAVKRSLRIAIRLARLSAERAEDTQGALSGVISPANPAWPLRPRR